MTITVIAIVHWQYGYSRRNCSKAPKPKREGSFGNTKAVEIVNNGSIEKNSANYKGRNRSESVVAEIN